MLKEEILGNNLMFKDNSLQSLGGGDNRKNK